MVKHSQTICRLTADELFECVYHFVGLALTGPMLKLSQVLFRCHENFIMVAKGFIKLFEVPQKCAMFFSFFDNSMIVAAEMKIEYT